jgi:2-succinyl-5-enolpyruvyl-6-hydroxy-3-cyclohexene-1-carboxylate synthase
MDINGQKSSPYLVDILQHYGITEVIICPGSRSAPLTLAFSRHSSFKCLSIVDERSAGYFALGLAQANQRPVAIVCTSGTAVLNLAPAITEAYYLHVPLLVLTADRPEAWIGQQDGQAIRQQGIYANIIAKSYHLKGELFNEDDLWFTQRTVNEACQILVSKSRPVHINCAFSEPLYHDDYTMVHTNKFNFYSTQATFTAWSEILAGKHNILVVIGQMPYNDSMRNTIESLQSFSRVVVVAENLANINSSCYINNAAEAIHYVNQKPDLIVYAGGAVVSKQIKKYLLGIGAPVARIQMDEELVDTFKNNQTLIQADTAIALKGLLNELMDNNFESDFKTNWTKASEKAATAKTDYLAKCKFSDLKVYEFIANHIPASSIIHLANSTPVRYAQIFNDTYKKDCQFYANRGTSGIDGSTSTAVGYTFGSNKVNFLITGDLSFQYDANAFFNQHLQCNLKIIIINNSGGNIFKVIEGPRELKECETLFETSLDHHFSHLANHFGLSYFEAESEKELSLIWHDFMKANNHKPAILEVFTNATESADIFRNFYKYLQQQ